MVETVKRVYSWKGDSQIFIRDWQPSVCWSSRAFDGVGGGGGGYTYFKHWKIPTVSSEASNRCLLIDTVPGLCRICFTKFVLARVCFKVSSNPLLTRASHTSSSACHGNSKQCPFLLHHCFFLPSEIIRPLQTLLIQTNKSNIWSRF